MNNLKIFISKNDNFFEAAQKIAKISNLKTNITIIEDFIAKKENYEISNDDIIYFLCNGEKVTYVIKNINNSKCKIVNKKFLINNYKKSDIQKKLMHSKIKVPKIKYFDEIKKSSLPIFCKEEQHAGMVFKIYTLNTITKIFEKFYINEFYFEEDVTKNIKDYFEFKVFYVDHKTYIPLNERINYAKVNEICSNIFKSISGLEVFSVDFIFANKEYYVIDINSSPGFFSLDDARLAFINTINKY